MRAPDGLWLVYSDGASRGNPGPAALGAVIFDPAGKLRSRISEVIEDTTNNVAEYKAIIAALEVAFDLGARKVEARMDSSLVVQQITGRYRVRMPHLVPYHRRLLALRDQFDEVVFRHVPRDQNKLADAYANAALDNPT